MVIESPKRIEVPSGCGTEKLTRTDFLRQIVNLQKEEPKKPAVKEKSDKDPKKRWRLDPTNVQGSFFLA